MRYGVSAITSDCNRRSLRHVNITICIDRNGGLYISCGVAVCVGFAAPVVVPGTRAVSGSTCKFEKDRWRERMGNGNSHVLVQFFLRYPRPSTDHLPPRGVFSVRATSCTPPPTISPSSVPSPSRWRPRSRRFSGNITIDALGRRLPGIRPPPRTPASVPAIPASAASGLLNAIEEAATWFDGRVERIAEPACWSGCWVGWRRGDQREADGLAVCVCAIEFSDRGAGGGHGTVSYVGGTCGAASAVVSED